MKKILVYFFMFVLVLSFIGCGAKAKLEEKAGEAIAEKIMEKASGGKVDVDGGTIKIKGEDGEELIMGSTEWPKSDLVKNIPEFKDGKIISVMETKDTVLISLDQVGKEDFSRYLEEIKKNYAENAFEFNSEGNVTYSADNGEEIGVQIYYVDDTLSISVTQASE